LLSSPASRSDPNTLTGRPAIVAASSAGRSFAASRTIPDIWWRHNFCPSFVLFCEGWDSQHQGRWPTLFRFLSISPSRGCSRSFAGFAKDGISPRQHNHMPFRVPNIKPASNPGMASVRPASRTEMTKAKSLRAELGRNLGARGSVRQDLACECLPRRVWFLAPPPLDDLGLYINSSFRKDLP